MVLDRGEWSRDLQWGDDWPDEPETTAWAERDFTRHDLEPDLEEDEGDG